MRLALARRGRLPLGAMLALLAGCSSNDAATTRSFDPNGAGGSAQGGGGGSAAGVPSYGGGGQAGSTFAINDAAPSSIDDVVSPWGDVALPSGAQIVPTEYGGYALGEAIDGSGYANTGVTVRDQACNTIAGVVRDFKDSQEGGHPDFEAFAGDPHTPGLVQDDLGPDGKPVYTGICETAGVTGACPYGQQTTSKANFDQWYRYTDGVNKPYIIYLQFAQNGGMMTMQSDNFFPLDDAGWGNNHKRGDGPRNFAFTTEIHTKFKYTAGAVFTFIGDDDLWAFINGKLAVDLGGLHQQEQGTVDLDANASKLGITPGEEYTLDVFHAERHTWESHFRIDTNFAFTDCGFAIPPDIK
jgi:fibro-slime domain-containing protein